MNASFTNVDVPWIQNNRRWLAVLALVLLAVSLSASCLAWRGVNLGLRLQARTAHDYRTGEITSGIANRIRQHEQVLLG